ncbi:hypothetical protein KM295_11690 [Natronomonas sp. F2-12]|jgi:hypothetical protein|uniref:Uncharacterized protein n=1 Tax=Natronomonas aquatica TaxID=2841590 RepID=A0A9R1CUH7_9EURY|nr:hypothetical protein [Natronomonas aquatica]MCQ4334130.1 hypothetical protein [Natronomonas aquatica]
MTTEEPPDTDPTGWRRWWAKLVYAAGWFADTFRGYSGSRRLREREK